MSEKTCKSCFWFKKRYDIFGYCRNPRNANVGSAGSDYSRSELLEPISVRVNQVCDLHEEGEPTEVKDVFEVAAVRVCSPDNGPYGSVKWKRVDTDEIIS